MFINGNDTRYTEWSADKKLFPLPYNSQITTNLGLSPYEMVSNQKQRKLRKRPYQITDTPTDVTYKLAGLNKKEIVQHRNSLLPYYPKEYALRKLAQLYSFTGLKVIQNNSEQNQNQSTDMHPIQK